MCLPLKTLSCLLFGERILFFSFCYGHTLGSLALNLEIFASLSLFNFQFHTHSLFDDLVFLFFAAFLDC